MASLQALYSNFKDDYGDLLEVPDFSIPTWLALGASLQLLSLRRLPSGLSYWLPLLYLLFRVARVSVDCQRIFTGTFTNVVSGRWTATLPEPEDSSTVTATSDGVVMFLLGARINHPLGKLAPGNAEIDRVFKDMWLEAEENRSKWSYLGRTATLFDLSDAEGITTFYISYWRDLKGLQDFATSTAHRLGQNAYLAKKFPYMGIMHETYHSPKGSWETIYDNMPPTGFGKAKYVIEEGPDGFRLGDTLKPNLKGSTI